MSIYTATVIRTGNSYALRVPKKYVDDTQVEVGQKVEIGRPIRVAKQNSDTIQRILRELQEMRALSHIEDPVEWQRAQRQDRPLPGRPT